MSSGSDRRAGGWRVMSGVVLAGTVLGMVLGLGGCKPPEQGFTPPPPPEVTVASPQVRMVPETLEFTGTTRGLETVDIRARVRGFLQTKNVEDGRRVKAGDLLFTIDPRTFQAAVKQAQAEVAVRESQLRLANVTLERTNQALKSNAVSQQELDKATAERDAAAAQVDLAKASLRTAELDLEFTEVKSPINGRIGFIRVDVGDLVGAGDATLLATVINDEKIYATYEIDERTVLQLREKYRNKRPGEDGRPTLPVMLGQANEAGHPHRGEFARGDNTVNSQTGTIRIESIFDNKDGTILPGAFVRIKPIFGEREAMLIPQTAVLQDQAGRYLLVVGEKNIVERLPVRVTGPVYERMLPIEELVGDTLAGDAKPTSKLTTSTRVIVNGIQRARPGAPVNPGTGAAGAPAPAAGPAASGAGSEKPKGG